MSEEELHVVTEAGLSCLSLVDRLLLLAVFNITNDFHTQ